MPTHSNYTSLARTGTGVLLDTPAAASHQEAQDVHEDVINLGASRGASQLSPRVDTAMLVRGATSSLLGHRGSDTGTDKAQGGTTQEQDEKYGTFGCPSPNEASGSWYDRRGSRGGKSTLLEEKNSLVHQGKASEDKGLRGFANHHKTVFAVTFAVFINLMDACTFGTILFPSEASMFNAVGISSFLLSTALVQLVFNLCSDFRCGLGTSMAENIPFLNAMAKGIIASVLQEGGDVRSAMPAVMVAYSLSTLMTGVMFYLVGFFRLGQVLHFFPRHVIIGCIGGFGVFLLITALEISTGLELSHMGFMEGLGALFDQASLWLWVSVVILQLGLRALERVKSAELLTPLYMMVVPAGFYLVLKAAGVTPEEARAANWLFPRPPPTDFLEMWSLFDLTKVHWGAVQQQMWAMCCLSLFILVLVPIRIPTLSLTTGEEADFDKEIKAHGISNMVAGLTGSVHNYLSYSNSVFYYNCGGRGPVPQWLVFFATLAMFMVGPSLINYVPRCVAGCVMMTLGVDLIRDALWESMAQLDSFEYSSVVIITATIAAQGFVSGIATGGVLACATFVLQSSRNSVVRATFSGEDARSNTMYSGRHRAKLEQSERQIHVIQLQGNIFFANVQQISDTVKETLKEAGCPDGDKTPGSLSGKRTPAVKQNMILDCTFVTTLDSTAMAALIKLELHLLDRSPPVEIAYAGLEPQAMRQLSKMKREQGLDDEEDFDEEVGELFHATTPDTSASAASPVTPVYGLAPSPAGVPGPSLGPTRDGGRVPYWGRDQPGIGLGGGGGGGSAVPNGSGWGGDAYSPSEGASAGQPSEKVPAKRHPSGAVKGPDGAAQQEQGAGLPPALLPGQQLPHQQGPSMAPMPQQQQQQQQQQPGGAVGGRSVGSGGTRRASSTYHADVNMALQNVEQDILMDMQTPKAVLGGPFFPRMDSLASLESDMSDGDHSAADPGSNTAATAGTGPAPGTRTAGAGPATGPRMGDSPGQEVASNVAEGRVGGKGELEHGDGSGGGQGGGGSPLTSPEVQGRKEAKDQPPRVRRRSPASSGLSPACKTVVRILRNQTAPGTPIETLARLGRILTVQEVAAGAVLWSDKDNACNACLLVSGSLKAVLGDGAGSPRAMNVIQTIMPGSFAGALGLLCQKKHSQTVVVAEDSVVAMLTEEQLATVASTDLPVLAVLQSIALSTAYERSQELSMFNAGSVPRTRSPGSSRKG